MKVQALEKDKSRYLQSKPGGIFCSLIRKVHDNDVNDVASLNCTKQLHD